MGDSIVVRRASVLPVIDSFFAKALTGENCSSCGYCHGAGDESYSTGMWAYRLTPQVYQILIDRGWRRSGQYLYKPLISKSCCPAYTIRLDSHKFSPTSGNKKVIKKMKKFLSQTSKANMAETQTDCVRDATGEEPMDGGEQEARKLLESHVRVSMNFEIAAAAQQNDTASASPNIRDKSSEKTKKAGVPWVKVKTKGTETRSSVDDLIQQAEFEQVENKLEVYATCVDNDLTSSILTADLIPGKFIPASEVLQTSTDATYEILETFPGYGSFHQKYYLNGILVAVSVLDILPSCVSAVYFMYDPSIQAVRNLSMGVYSALRECAMAKQFSQLLPDLRYYYMGFYIHSCAKMRYKAQFKPSDLACPKTYEWVPVDKCLPLLDVHKVALLSSALSSDKLPSADDTSVFGASAVYGEYQVDAVTAMKMRVLRDGAVLLLAVCFNALTELR
ncbi:Arginyl-tRNA--protein transferase 1 [Entophlyctis sp. JEL0112]|nr:Arginyl-tRNA--protein transferase 1 [Entophlyctis sp. JEL0112]